MPELPEVEAIRRRIEPALAGGSIQRCIVTRRDVVRDPLGRRTGRIPRSLLGEGRRLDSIDRRGKQVILRLTGGGGIVIRLGMSGRLDLRPSSLRRRTPDHRHLTWTIRSVDRDPGTTMRLEFIDPRRFGGVHLARDEQDLEDRLLGRLGPEGLQIAGPALFERLAGTRRVVKTALLDQSVVAGVGNIYADESLHAARIHPGRPGSSLTRSEAGRLATAIREILGRAVEAGGSTIRDHRLPDGSEGGFAARLTVYGRAGSTCERCGTILEESRISARSTTWCPTCQHAPEGWPP